MLASGSTCANVYTLTAIPSQDFGLTQLSKYLDVAAISRIAPKAFQEEELSARGYSYVWTL